MNDNIKNSKCFKCGNNIIVKKHSSHELCENCKKNSIEKKKKKCKICGQKEHLYPNICKKRSFFPTLIKYFNFDKNKIGTIEVYDEFNRIKKMLETDYYDNKLTIMEIMKKYNYKNNNCRNFSKIFIAFNIKRRTLSEAVKNSFLKNKRSVSGNNFNYKHGWHKTWDNKSIFYRSSYELFFAKLLDENKIKYEVEKIRIKYFDSNDKKYKIAISDFFIPEKNLIIEIKSKYTYNEKNINDKFIAYKNAGYSTKLIIGDKLENFYDCIKELNERWGLSVQVRPAS